MPRAHLAGQGFNQAAVQLNACKGQAREPPAMVAKLHIIQQDRNAQALQAQHHATQAGRVANRLGFRQFKQKRPAPCAMPAECVGKQSRRFRQQQHTERHIHRKPALG